MALKRKARRGESELFPGFVDVTEIGGGGFATVYSAHESETGRQVALKLLNVREISQHALDSFRRETVALGALSTHPNIVTLYRTLSTSDGRPVLVMELCHGTVADGAKRGVTSPRDAVSIAIKIAGALETAHRADMLHRDVKPQNLLVTQYGEPALADFGVARLQSSSEATVGVFGFTTLHAAPEMLEGAKASAATDVYELASTLYQLLAGRAAFRSFDGEAPASVILRILRDPVQPLLVDGVPLELSDLLLWCMEKAPEDRPSTAREFAERLKAIENSQGWPQTSYALVGNALDQRMEDPPVTRSDLNSVLEVTSSELERTATDLSVTINYGNQDVVSGSASLRTHGIESGPQSVPEAGVILPQAVDERTEFGVSAPSTTADRRSPLAPERRVLASEEPSVVTAEPNPERLILQSSEAIEPELPVASTAAASEFARTEARTQQCPSGHSVPDAATCCAVCGDVIVQQDPDLTTNEVSVEESGVEAEAPLLPLQTEPPETRRPAEIPPQERPRHGPTVAPTPRSERRVITPMPNKVVARSANDVLPPAATIEPNTGKRSPASTEAPYGGSRQLQPQAPLISSTSGPQFLDPDPVESIVIADVPSEPDPETTHATRASVGLLGSVDESTFFGYSSPARASSELPDILERTIMRPGYEPEQDDSEDNLSEPAGLSRFFRPPKRRRREEP